jgi:hypothetical protein
VELDDSGLPKEALYVRMSDLSRVLRMSGDLIRHHLRVGNFPEHGDEIVKDGCSPGAMLKICCACEAAHSVTNYEKSKVDLSNDTRWLVPISTGITDADWMRDFLLNCTYAQTGHAN